MIVAITLTFSFFTLIFILFNEIKKDINEIKKDMFFAYNDVNFNARLRLLKSDAIFQNSVIIE